MKQHLTISEFARLRGVNINSLRYYEKLGLLRPARVDPHTGYRYYRPEQLSQLDTILLCIMLGIPLKELSGYVDEQGNLQNRRLLEDGRRLAQKRMAEIQDGLEKIERSLRSLDETRLYEGRQEPYTRRIEARRLYTAAYTQDLADAVQMEKTFTALYTAAQEQGLSPLLPAGVLVQRGETGQHVRLFCEVVGGAGVPGMVEIPAGEFLCLQIDLREGTNMAEMIVRNFPGGREEPVIVSNMFLNKFRFDSKRTEIQQRRPSSAAAQPAGRTTEQ